MAAPDLLAEVARRHYVFRRSQTDIAEEYGVDQSTVHRWVNEARDRRIVVFNIDPSFGSLGHVDDGLSQSVRETFQLNEALVVDANVTDATSLQETSNRTHDILGNVSGERHANLIEADCHIAVAGGRTVHRAVQFIRRLGRAQHGVCVTPLSGRMWSGRWQLSSSTFERPLDPDDNAFVLASAFERERGTSFSQISHALYAKDSDEALGVIKEFTDFLPDGSWNWNLEAPSRAIVGIGVFSKDTGHRLLELLERGHLNQSGNGRYGVGFMKHVSRELDEVRDFVRRNELQPFADVANRLFPCLPLPAAMRQLDQAELRQKTFRYKELNEKLDAINRKCIVIQWTHLRSIKSVWATAGTIAKLAAIWTLLLCGLHDKNHGRQRIVDSLTIDDETARMLLNAYHTYRSDAAIADWYSQTLQAACPFMDATG